MNDVMTNILSKKTTRLIDGDKHLLAELEREVLDEDGMPKVVPAEVYLKYPHDQLRVFGGLNGLFVFPTCELVDFLRKEIGTGKALEIGAGNGVVAKELGAIATDNYQQSPDFRPEPKFQGLWRQLMDSLTTTGNAPVRYGEHVLRQDAISAVVKHRPDVTYGLFVTHRVRVGESGGSVMGIEEHKILKRSRYIMAGNLVTHEHKHLLALPHQEITLPGLVTRAAVQDANRIFIWEKQAR